MKNTQTASFTTNVAISAAALLSFIGVLIENSMNVTFPQLSQLFHVQLGLVQWITTGYLLMVTLTMSTTAYLIKRFNLKNIFIVASGAFVLGDLLCALAPNFWILLTGRLFQGAATGLAFPIMYQIIFTKVPKLKIAFYTGVASMVIALAPALGPSYGGVLSSLISWRFIFIIVLPFALVAFLIGVKFINVPGIGNKKKFSFVSLISLAVSFFALMMAVNELGIKGSSAPVIMLLFAVGIIALIVFLIADTHGKSQLVKITRLKSPAVSLNFIPYCLLMFINIGISFVIPIFLETVVGTSAMVAGLVLLPGSVIGGLIAPLAGACYDRFGPFKPIILGFLLLSIGNLMFVAFTKSLNPITISLLFIIVQVGFNSSFGNIITNAQMNTPVSETSDINSVFNMSQQFTGAIGICILSTILTACQNQDNGLSLMVKSMVGSRLEFALIFGLGILALLLSIINYLYQTKWEKFNGEKPSN